jgi:dolichol kinase
VTRGSATAIGIFLYLTAVEIAAERFNPFTLGAILLVAILVFFASRNGDVTGLVVFPLMTVLTPLELGITANSILNTVLAAFLSASVVGVSVSHGIFKSREDADAERKERKLWRIIARPFALLFVPIDLFWGRKTTLLVLGAVAMVFILIDLIRLLGRWEIATLIKAKEARRFSSMTYFLLAVFVAFLAFPAEIPYLALCFTAMGDLFGKLIGYRFGRTRLHGSKTLEGALAFFAGSFAAGYTLRLLVALPLSFIILGGAFAAVVELFSERLDDNFSVPLLSGGLLMALRYFLKI